MVEAVVVAEAGEVAMDSIVEDQVLFQADLVEDIEDRLDIIESLQISRLFSWKG